ncbi:MAG: hypothetical protein L0Y64_01700 [Myxococcaceae bacterium]|nr:hypothetical protein [Myxococcaceae bacterium]
MGPVEFPGLSFAVALALGMAGLSLGCAARGPWCATSADVYLEQATTPSGAYAGQTTTLGTRVGFEPAEVCR